MKSEMLQTRARISPVLKGHLGYTLCFDNVNQKLTVRHQVRDKSNKMLNMVQGYAAQDRIPTLHLSDAQPDPDTVLQIPLSSYLPSDLDEALLRSEITVTIMRILGSNIPIFQDLKMDKHIRHPYQKESSKKSNIVRFLYDFYNTTFHKEMQKFIFKNFRFHRDIGCYRCFAEFKIYVNFHGHLCVAFNTIDFFLIFLFVNDHFT